tara:strand:- start:140 stop:667 length:528 start_codon:yes stop_codon:yes gene_type:complete
LLANQYKFKSPKTGVIILFSNDEQEIQRINFNKILKNNSIKFCLVNNASKDNTIGKLENIYRQTNNIAVLDIKKDKGIKVAVKAGVRYLKNHESLNAIVYFEFNKIQNFENLMRKVNLLFTEGNGLKSKLNSSTRTNLKNILSLEELIGKKEAAQNEFIPLMDFKGSMRFQNYNN